MKNFKLASLLRPCATAFRLVFMLLPASVAAQPPAQLAPVEMQPLAAQVRRLIETLDYLGAPLDPMDKQALERAINATDAGLANRTERRKMSIPSKMQRVSFRYCLARSEPLWTPRF